jgi:hypothetical protein
VFVASDPRLFLFTDLLLQTTHDSLTPAESADPKNSRVTRLESTLPNSLDLKSFRIRTSKKGPGEGANC